MALALLLVAPLATSAAAQAISPEPLDLELRIAFGGGTPQQWQGTISLTAGELQLTRVLGLEPDTPGSSRLLDGRLHLAQRSPRSYDGLDISVRAPREARLVIELSSPGGQPRVEIPLAELIAGVHSSALDEEQNRLLVRRTPGDRLRLNLERDALVFETAETVRFSVQPHEAGLPSDTSLRCRVRLVSAEDDAELWNTERDFRLDRSGIVPILGPFECPLPEREGVYKVVIEVSQPPRLGVALVRTKPLLSREMQLVAISPTPATAADVPWETVLEIDPAHPGWLERLTRLTRLTSIPGFGKEPLGNRKAAVTPHLQTSLVQLATEGWQAYPLPIKQPGQPHILEIEFPNDAAQTLGISILEPNAAGQVTPLGVDSGIDVPEPAATTPKRLEKHRLVFWPRTKTPLVLITNRHAKSPGAFGKLRVLAGPAHLPTSVAKANDNRSGRLLAAYYDRPLFPENFHSGEAVDPPSGRTLDDWTTFYQGARRMVEELKFAGYNGAIISVACEGSAIYPSQLLESTPKYDMGTFFASGQDPLRKDVLEMLFRMFNREGLQLVPALQFSAPLVELEALRAERVEALGLELVGADGKPWLVARGTRRGMAPYYNPLDERVRDAMRRVVDELALRYAHHEAFAGVSLQLGPETFAQLPGEEWGYDRRTLLRFQTETKTPLGTLGPGEFPQLVRQLQTTERDAWLAWRAQQVATLYTSISRDLVRQRGAARLYLAGGEMLHNESLLKHLRVTLPAQANVQDALLAAGFDARLLQAEANIVLLRPRRQFAPGLLAAQAGHLELNRSRELDRQLQDWPSAGEHLFHEPATLRLSEFDAVSPFGAANTHVFMATQFSPAGSASRRRFIQSLLAHDAQAIADGGWMLPLGQEDATRELMATYRELPPVRLAMLDPPAAASQPVACRAGVYEGQSYVYLVNPTPWPISVKLVLTDPQRGTLTALGGRTLPLFSQAGETSTLTLELAPYDLVGLRSTSVRLQVSGWQCTVPAAAIQQLRQQIDRLRARTTALRTIKPLEVLPNAGFEQADNKTPLAGWVHASEAEVRFELDTTEARGKQALRVRSEGPVAWLRSDPIPVPKTGRISVWVWLKIKDPSLQPALRLAIEGRHRDRTYYRFASVGAAKGAPPLKSDWAPYLFQVDDLPTSELTDLRVGFDLMGAGEVWIDDVQVFDLYFHDHEQDELLKMLALADLHLEKGQIGDCLRLLEGYWPRYLTEYVPLAPAQVASPSPASKPARPLVPMPSAPEGERTSLRDRVWNWVPKWR